MQNLAQSKAFERYKEGIHQLFEQNNAIQAFAEFSRASLLDSNEPAFPLQKAEALLDCGEISSAILMFRLALSLIEKSAGAVSPRYIERRLSVTHNLYGITCLDVGRFRDALRHFDIAYDYGWNQESMLLNKAFANIGLGNIEVAEQQLCTIINQNPNFISAIVLRARCYMIIGNADFVNIDLERLISLDKDHPAIEKLTEFVIRRAVQYKNVASEMILKENVGMAVLCLNHAIELDSKDWVLHFKRGVLLSQLGHFESALIDLKNALDLMKHEKEANQVSAAKEQSVLDHLGSIYNQMGIIAYEKGRGDIAVQHFSEALNCNPNVPSVYKNRSDAYFTIKQLENAKSDLQAALRISDDGDIESTKKLAKLNGLCGKRAFANGDYYDAIMSFTVAIELDPTTPDFWFERARTFDLMRMDELTSRKNR